MDYEKKYKEALEMAREELQKCGSLDCDCAKQMFRLFPELRESENERIRQEIINVFHSLVDGNIPITINFANIFTWLEKQGEQPSAIRWYDVSLIPQELEELLVEWDSEDATWHEIAFYHADTKTFWNGTRQVENVTRWCYIIDLFEKQETSYWKPSEEQIRALEYIINNAHNTSYSCKIAKELLEELKKLTE